jgi:hypothetical protein
MTRVYRSPITKLCKSQTETAWWSSISRTTKGNHILASLLYFYKVHVWTVVYSVKLWESIMRKGTKHIPVFEGQKDVKANRATKKHIYSFKMNEQAPILPLVSDESSCQEYEHYKPWSKNMKNESSVSSSNKSIKVQVATKQIPELRGGTVHCDGSSNISVPRINKRNSQI